MRVDQQLAQVFLSHLETRERMRINSQGSRVTCLDTRPVPEISREIGDDKRANYTAALFVDGYRVIVLSGRSRNPERWDVYPVI